MPKIKAIAYTNVFSQLNNTSFAAGETNDCAVKAIALVCDIPYHTARETLTALGRKPRRGAYINVIFDAARRHGKTVMGVNIQNIIALYPQPHRDVLKNITTHHPRRFNKVWPKGKYLLFSKGHVSACIDGVLHDWAVNKAKRVTHVYKVLD